MGTPFDPTNPLHNIITDEAGNPVPQKYDPEANSGQGGMVVVSTEDVQKVQQVGSVRKITVCPSITVTGQEKKILIDDYTFEKGTIAWGLYFIESSRTLSNILNYMYIRVEMTSGWDYSITPHGRCNFRQDIALSTQDEFDKGLAVDMVDVLGVDDTSLRKNIILAGKYFNVPLGERIRISIINTAPEGEFTFYINQASFVEEGIF